MLSGRQHGSDARRLTGLEAVELDPNVDVRVIIPPSVFSITSSFFLGMFGDTIARLGAQAFRQRFKFEGMDASSVVEQGIRRALLTGTPLRSGLRPRGR